MNRAFGILVVLLAMPAVATALTSHGSGGAGRVHGAAFHPADPDVIVIAPDTYGISRTDDGGQSWYMWNKGLANIHNAWTNFVDDLIGVDTGDWQGFYAATRGGLFRAHTDGEWEWLTEPPAYCFGSSAYYRPQALSFMTLALNLEGDLLAMGAGRCRWGRSEEWEYYPGLPDSVFEPWGDGPVEQWSVWTLDPRDLDSRPEPLGDCRFGTARALACRKLDGVDHVVVGTPEGIYLHDGVSWQSIADEGYSTYGLDCWGLELTSRGTLYAVMARQTGSNSSSGCYRIADVRGPLNWEWLGDDTLLAPDAVTMQQTGLNTGFAYVSVIEGQASEPDVLFMSGRGGANVRSGLYRARLHPATPGASCTWRHKAWKESDSVFWQVDESGVQHPLDPGWVTLWAGHIDFEPTIYRQDPNNVFISFQGRLHLSRDGGHDWTQCYTDVSGGYARSRGYDELVTQGIDYLSDGRVVLGNADLGALISEDETLDGYKWFYPELDRQTTYDTDAAYNREAAGIEVRPDWLGSGADGLFILCSDLTHHGAPSKLLRAPPAESFNWTNTMRTLNTENKFIPDFCFAGDSVVFAPFLESNIAWGEGAVLSRTGVLRGQCLGHDNWIWTERSEGLMLPNGWNASGRDVIFHEASGRVFLATQHLKTPAGDLAGGVFMLDSVDDTSWELVCGLTGDWRNFQCLAQAADGSRLYAGTAGPGGMGDGGVLRCLDPFGAPDQWDVIANGIRGDFGFERPFYGEGWSQLDASRNLTDVRGLVVDPSDPDIVYAGISSYRFLKSMGLWAFNRNGDGRWSYLFYGSPLEHQGVHRLKFHPQRPAELGICTAGVQFWTLDVDSLGFTAVPASGDQAGLRLLGVTWDGKRADIRYALNRPSPLVLRIYDIQGRRIFGRDVSRAEIAGRLAWHGHDDRGASVASGLYFVRLESSAQVATAKLTLLR